MRVVLGVLIGGLVGLAAEPGGMAVPVAGLSVNGAAVPATGAKSWPVRTGDELRTAGAPTVLTLRDGSKVVLGAHSVVRLDGASGGRERLRLVSGGMRYTMSGEARTQLVVDGKELPAGPGSTGTVGQMPVQPLSAPVTPLLTPSTVSRERKRT